MDTTTKALVGGNNDEEFVWGRGFRGCVYEELYGEIEIERM